MLAMALLTDVEVPRSGLISVGVSAWSWLAGGLHHDGEVSGWWRSDGIEACPTRAGPAAYRSIVLAGNHAGRGRLRAAGQHQFGLSLAPSVACGWNRRADLDRAGLQPVSSQPRSTGPIGCGVGSRPGRTWVGRGPTLDTGADQSVDRPVVPHLLHPAWCVLSAAPDGLEPASPHTPRHRPR